MNVSCPQCSTIYRVDPAKVPAGGVRARCSNCGGVIPVGMQETASRRTPAMNAPVPEGPTAPPRTATPPRPMTPPRSAALPQLRPTPRTPWPSVATPSAPAPVTQPPQTFRSSETPVSVPAVTHPPPTTAATYGARTPAPPAPGERRPINPFLSRDPGLRAKRLARALVSDMVAYYPAKHSEGLQQGTLRELFREEIKKSYEEYVAQVGAELARSTTHFQEALNEILGAGKRIF